MEERRKEPRVRAEVWVEVSGKDARCDSYRERVLAMSLSRSGALLTNVHAELRCGDLIGVEHEDCHAYFRIVWVLSSGEMDGMKVAIHKLTSQACPWEKMLPAEPALASHLDPD
jgi:hypothetical protein